MAPAGFPYLTESKTEMASPGEDLQVQAYKCLFILMRRQMPFGLCNTTSQQDMALRNSSHHDRVQHDIAAGYARIAG